MPSRIHDNYSSFVTNPGLGASESTYSIGHPVEPPNLSSNIQFSSKDGKQSSADGRQSSQEATPTGNGDLSEAYARHIPSLS